MPHSVFISVLSLTRSFPFAAKPRADRLHRREVVADSGHTGGHVTFGFGLLLPRRRQTRHCQSTTFFTAKSLMQRLRQIWHFR
jgi:hypothetical protein